MVEERLKEFSDLLEPALEGCFPTAPCRQSEIFAACRYSLLGGGKRIRPALLLEFYRLCGGSTEDAIPFACALEMIHTYSLIHDDLPCMDNDDFRRGRLSNHRVYGEGMATLAGDALLNCAFETMLSVTTIPAKHALEAAAYIGRCSGVYGMIGGQVQDLALEGKRASAEEQQEMVDLKTAALLRAACVGGAILAGADQRLRDAAEAYADAIGLAFQIRDDILDVIGSAQVLGKAIGSDEANEKSTFVTLFGLPACQQKVKALTEQAIAAAEILPDHEFLCDLAVFLAERMK